MKLKQWLKLNKVKRLEIARGISVTPVYISHLISGYRKPSRIMMKKIHDFTEGQVSFEEWY